MNINDGNLDICIDKYFCKNCEIQLIWYRGESKVKYVLSIGWYRFGIKIRDEHIKIKLRCQIGMLDIMELV